MACMHESIPATKTPIHIHVTRMRDGLDFHGTALVCLTHQRGVSTRKALPPSAQHDVPSTSLPTRFQCMPLALATWCADGSAAGSGGTSAGVSTAGSVGGMRLHCPKLLRNTGGGGLGFGRQLPPPPPSTNCWPQAPGGGGVPGGARGGGGRRRGGAGEGSSPGRGGGVSGTSEQLGMRPRCDLTVCTALTPTQGATQQSVA